MNFLFFSEVYLGRKINHPDVIYAIKVMKKSEMIHKNMASQGILRLNLILFIFCRNLI